MSIPENRRYSIVEYQEICEKYPAKCVEYLDGFVLMSPSPSVEHQRISMRLSATLYNLLKSSSCEPFAAPFDVELTSDDVEGLHIVMPDLAVICNQENLTNNKYKGVPELILEILSPSNQSHDLVYKLDLYMRYGVKEYWIINPLNRSVQLYVLNDERSYNQVAAANVGIVTSHIVEGFEIDTSSFFGD
ncbi:Uma2 family endonuclease [Shouchella shacheensis]|uniref:Uma2 family endonuclease n=1 Tax=Shouchella shacheensis TaxID=1649580 RepID=UPI00073FC538|nr:Uma2 family endonuclease [Shouchella shacheensis]